MTPSISVIMPCHNAEGYLGPAIDSVLRQSLGDFELIAIDDGSTDCTRASIERAASGDARIRLLAFDENRGIIAALNAGLDAARGTFIARMDADDICEPTRFEHQRDYLQRHALDLCGTWFTEFGQGPSRIVRWPYGEAALRAAMLFQNTICHPTVMARRAVFDRLRYREDYRLVEDYDVWSRACVEFRVANLPEPLLRYRRHGKQASTTKAAAMDAVNRRIRAETLQRQGFAPSDEELRLHHCIRAAASITDATDLTGVESWLRKLHDAHTDTDARRVIASQWLRACIRAAPLGRAMLRIWHASPLRAASGAGARADWDLAALAALRMDYRSPLFSALRRLGLSA